MPNDVDLTHELKVLEHIETNPDTTQADIATQLGGSFGFAQGKLCRLTCVEQGVTVVAKQGAALGTPTVVIDGAHVTLGAE